MHRLVAWGANAAAQLGTGARGSSHSLPHRVVKEASAAAAVRAIRRAQPGNDASTGTSSTSTITSSTSSSTSRRNASAVADVACGPMHSLVAMADGSLVGFGTNEYAQLGPLAGGRRQKHVATPTLLDLATVGAPRVLRAAAGRSHTCVVVRDGSGDSSRNAQSDGVVGTDVFAWGEGLLGQLGDGVPREEGVLADLPVRVIGLSPAELRKSRQRQLQTKAASGDSGGEQQGVEDDSVALLASGLDHNVALTTQGRVFTWGFNGDGQCGLGHFQQGVLVPHELDISRRDDVRMTFAACGHDFTLLVTDGGLLLSCGNNDVGQLGLGDTEMRNGPTLVEVLAAGPGVAAVAAGASHALALDADGNLWSWGAAAGGVLGDGVHHSVEIDPHTMDAREQLDDAWANIDGSSRRMQPTNLAEYTAEQAVSQRVTKANEGKSESREQEYDPEDAEPPPLDPGTQVKRMPHRTVPDLVDFTLPSGEHWVQIGCGGAFSAALSSAGRLYTWGYGGNGRLGHGDERDRTRPEVVAALEDIKVLGFDCGSDHIVAVIEDVD